MSRPRGRIGPSGGHILACGITCFSSTSHVFSVTDRCLEPMSEGTCSDFVLLWYFHIRSGECRPFVFGGCGGNRNRFSSRQECLSWCGMEMGKSEKLSKDLIY
uniref:BPTI/Kunitz inhibitor domain-containing protein n=1 Tax=Amphiprion percula TaxID=161767 RepID=A0A3P8S6N0_AMPPE